MKKLTLFLLLISNIAVCQNSLKDKQSQISEYVQKVKDEYNISGLVVAISNENEIEYIESFGNVLVDDNFIIGSNSKAFTALIILKLQEKGLLNIDDPVVKYLDWFHYQNIRVSNKITIKDLLQHTSGLSTEMGRESLVRSKGNVKSRMAKKLKKLKIDTYPITDFEYSNTNYQLLGFIIEKVTNKDYGAVLKAEITSPFLMNNTSTVYSKDIVQGYQYFLYYPIIPVSEKYNKVDIPAGYINSNAYDLSKYLRALMNSYNKKSDTLVKNMITNELFKPNDKNNSRYGLGWVNINYYGTKILFHSGLTQSFQTSLIIVPEKEKSIIVLINSYGDNAVPISFGILNILSNKEPYSPSMSIFYLIRSLPILAFILFIVLLISLKKWKKKHYPIRMTKKLFPNLFTVIGIIVGLGFILYVPSLFKASLKNALDFDVSTGYSLILLCVLTIAISIIIYFNNNTLPNK